MGKKWFRKYYHSPRTTQERRSNCEYYNKADREDGIRPVICRGNRKPCNLPNIYDDEPIARRGKGWKAKGRKTQYRPVGERAVKHTIRVDRWPWQNLWRLECYFDDYDIPYRTEEVGHTEVKVYWITTERVLTTFTPWYTYKNDRQVQVGWWPVYEDVELPEPKRVERRYRVTDYYIVTYWLREGVTLSLEKILRPY